MPNRAAQREITQLEDEALALRVKANHEKGEQQAATLEQLSAVEKTIEITRWSYEEVRPTATHAHVKTT